jgi:DNA-binding protein H-NS
LGNWSKGLQKGLRAYQGRTYDEEREEMERQAIVEQQAGEKNVITEMNRDIYAMDHIAEQLSAQEIEAEEMLLHHLGEDDDHGERDGDEFY